MSDFKVKFELEGTVREEVFQPPAPLLAGAHVRGLPSYHELYKKSINDPDLFWKTVAAQLYFETDSDKGLEYNFDHHKGDVFVRFMSGARSNIAYNCLERNIAKGLGSKTAFIWEGNEPNDQSSITYQDLLDKVISFSAVLRSKGVKKGDVVAIYLPMVVELPISMLACARIGAIHSVVFAGFSSDSLSARMCQGKSKVLITADAFFRSNKTINLKLLADYSVEISALNGHIVEHVIVLEHFKRISHPKKAPAPSITYNDTIDCKWVEEMEKCKGVESPVEWCEAEDSLFILYTSGSTGKPKGIVHSTVGYMVYSYYTTKLTFDAQPDDILWTTADCGWITGHSYVTYGPLLNGMTSLIFEGVPSYPNSSRMWQVVEKYGITKLYTAPTAVRALMAFSNDLVTKHNRSSLKLIGLVGEPINPTAWKWLYDVVGEQRCAVIDTYWQTETGGHVITALPGATPLKPGSATLPFLGVHPSVVDGEGRILEGPGEGNLCFNKPWPGMMRSVYGDHDRYVKTYFSSFPGYYFTGDGARRDEDGYYWITGRVDDLMNVSGHLLSTAEIESALVTHLDVVEAAVVAAAHDIKGQAPYAFVTMSGRKQLNETIIAQLKNIVRVKIGAIAVPDVIHQAPGLPKTRSGKVTRRILRKIAEGDEKADLGDTTTLIDETVIGLLWQCHPCLRTG